MSKRPSAATVLMVAAVLTGCATTVPGKPVAGETPGPSPPPVAAGDLDGLLLNDAEINEAMGATGMTVSESTKQMWDSSTEISETECLPVYGAGEYEVYTGSGWSAIRYVSLQEPEEDPPHFAEQSVVAFPNQDAAAKFFGGSEESWARCADRQYKLNLPEYDLETLWTVGTVENDEGMLTTSMIMEDGDGWGCERALTVASNVAVDVTTCSYNRGGGAAVTIARDIAEKLPKG
jgi:PknH-like extracellular domain